MSTNRERYLRKQGLPRLLSRLAGYSAVVAQANKNRKSDQPKAVAMMRELGIVEYETDGLRAKLVDEETVTERDDAAILSKLPADVALSIVTIDPDKLAVAIAEGKVDLGVVEEHTRTYKESRDTPYIRVTLRAET